VTARALTQRLHVGKKWLVWAPLVGPPSPALAPEVANDVCARLAWMLVLIDWRRSSPTIVTLI
jgi:hypothetical protein